MEGPKFGEFCWNDLATSDVKKAKKFYGELFGWSFAEHQVGEATYTMIKGQNWEFGGMWQIPEEDAGKIPPHWMGYILVEDIEKTLEKAAKLGATIKMPVTKAGEMGLFCIVVDPTGAHIAFWQSLT